MWYIIVTDFLSHLRFNFLMSYSDQSFLIVLFISSLFFFQYGDRIQAVFSKQVLYQFTKHKAWRKVLILCTVRKHYCAFVFVLDFSFLPTVIETDIKCIIRIALFIYVCLCVPQAEANASIIFLQEPTHLC